jgi:phosphatidylglycerophosphate synthase
MATDQKTDTLHNSMSIDNIINDGMSMLQTVATVIANHKSIQLELNNINEYNLYKYSCVEDSFLANMYRKYFLCVQKLVNPKIHPNMLTFFGLLSVFIGYGLSRWSYTSMAISVFLYLTFDGIDGIHARTTGQTSIIGEYLDHVFDLINTGLISIVFCNSIGMTSIPIQNMYVTCCSLTFLLPHIKSTNKGVIVFEGLTDVSLVLSTVIFTFLANIKLYDWIVNSYFTYSSLFSVYCYFLYDLHKEEFSNENASKIKRFVIYYYIVKSATLILNPTISVWQITLCDIYLLMQITNYKIFKLEFDTMTVFIPAFYSMYPTITIIGSLYYFIKTMHQLSTELKINVLYNPESMKNEEDSQLSTKKNS